MKIPTEWSCWAKIQRRSNGIVVEIPAERICGAKKKKNDGMVIKIPTERPCGGKIQIKSNGIVIEILAERPCGAKNLKEK